MASIGIIAGGGTGGTGITCWGIITGGIGITGGGTGIGGGTSGRTGIGGCISGMASCLGGAGRARPRMAAGMGLGHWGRAKHPLLHRLATLNKETTVLDYLLC